MILLEKEKKRFFNKVKKYEDGCWEWTGCLTPSGYGQLKIRRLHATALLAHRISYQEHLGDIPAGLYVCHSCDNRLCVNPKHLFIGTHQDNMNDMVAKGRCQQPETQGIDNGNSKLTEEIVLRICEDLPSFNNKELALRYNVTHSNISCIRRGKSWGHLTGITSDTFKKYKSLTRNGV